MVKAVPQIYPLVSLNDLVGDEIDDLGPGSVLPVLPENTVPGDSLLPWQGRREI